MTMLSSQHKDSLGLGDEIFHATYLDMYINISTTHSRNFKYPCTTKMMIHEVEEIYNVKISNAIREQGGKIMHFWQGELCTHTYYKFCWIFYVRASY